MGRFASVIAVMLLAFVATGCGRREPIAAADGTAAAQKRKVVLQTDWFPQAEHGGYYQALAKGFYADAGLDVDIWAGGPGAGIKLKVARGDADFGMLRSDDVILAASRDMPLVMVMATMQHDVQALMVHESSPVRDFKDLDGRAVIGNVGMVYFPLLEQKFGIRLERRQNTYGLGEFLANPDAIQQCIVTNEPFFAAQQGRKVRVLPLAASGYDCYQTVFTRREVLRVAPEMVRAFVQASIRGWRDYLDGDPAPANALILQRNANISAELLAFSRAEMKRGQFVTGQADRGEDIGRISPARIAEQVETLRQLKIVERPVTVESVMTTDFLPAPKR